VLACREFGHQGDELLFAARHADIGHPLAVHDDERHRRDVIMLVQIFGLVHLGDDGERAARLAILLFVHAVRSKEAFDLAVRIERVFVDVDFTEDRRVQLFELTESLRGVEQLRMGLRHLVPNGGHADELHVIGFALLAPRFDQRIEIEAMRTAVPEHFDDFYMAGRNARRLCRCEPPVVDPLPEGRRRTLRPGSSSDDARQEQSNDCFQDRSLGWMDQLSLEQTSQPENQRTSQIS